MTRYGPPLYPRATANVSWLGVLCASWHEGAEKYTNPGATIPKYSRTPTEMRLAQALHADAGGICADSEQPPESEIPISIA